MQTMIEPVANVEEAVGHDREARTSASALDGFLAEVHGVVAGYLKDHDTICGEQTNGISCANQARLVDFDDSLESE